MKQGSIISIKRLGLLAWGLELVAWIACGVLEYQAGYKAGVMRHLSFRKYEHLAGIYASDALSLHIGMAVAVVLGLLALIGAQRRRLKRKTSDCVSVFIMLLVQTVLFITVLFLPALQELYIYTYLLMVLESAITIFALLVLASLVMRRK